MQHTFEFPPETKLVFGCLFPPQTALHLAVITEQPHLVDRLLKAGCDPRLADNSGNTALHIACKRGSLACFGVITQNSQHHLSSIVSFPNYSGTRFVKITPVAWEQTAVGHLFSIPKLEF